MHVDVEERVGLLAELRRVAGAQQGVITSEQLLAIGPQPGSSGRRFGTRLVSEGWLYPLLGGAYAVGASPSDWQMAVAAVLLSGPESVLSHRSAARCHRISDLLQQTTPEVTLPRYSHRRVSGVIVHRVGALDHADISLHHGIRVTSPERTLVDLANDLDIGLVERIFDEGAVARLWSAQSVTAAVERNARRRGTIALRRILACRADLAPGESTLESRAIKVLAPYGPFEVQYQLSVDDRLVIIDIAWPKLRVAVECDGWTVRSRSRGKFDADRRRDNILASHGWSVVHLTTAMSDDEMRKVVFRQLFRAGGAEVE